MTSLRTLFAAGSLMLLGASVVSAQAGRVTCTDGSASVGGRGACSGHGGIMTPAMKAKLDAEAKAKAEKSAALKVKADAKAAKVQAKADAKAAKAEKKADAKADMKVAKADAKADRADDRDARDARGATAECRDHTYSHAKSHQGACSRHGGVAKFIAGR